MRVDGINRSGMAGIGMWSDTLEVISILRSNWDGRRKGRMEGNDVTKTLKVNNNKKERKK